MAMGEQRERRKRFSIRKNIYLEVEEINIELGEKYIGFGENI